MLPKRKRKLDDRLAACASLVRENCKLADIGTDHAYLPIALAQEGRIQQAIASDIHVGPLQKAAMHVRKYGLEEKIQTRISDGLEVIFPNEADDIVIAGMGGELIARIIDSAPWLQDPDKHLILQPMTAPEELRCALREHGFSVREETAVLVEEKVYGVMLAVYDPEHPNTDPLFPYLGLLNGTTPQGAAYIERQIRFYRNKAEGLKRAGKLAQAAPVEQLLCQMEQRLNETKGGSVHDNGTAD
ncbi:MAG: class I SAM-dependent methyltransferase [Oscillospiraceae bacterium]|nr:class I SAM-dependent methyltransferase [Oscillospiraceae bacterium]